MSAGWRMSTLYLGIRTSPAPRSSLLFRRHALSWGGVSSSPVRSLTRDLLNRIFLGDISGVILFLIFLGYSTPTDSILAPMSASVATITARTSSPASASVEVTSMKRFLVLVSTLVSTPLIIGGKERTTPFESLRMG